MSNHIEIVVMPVGSVTFDHSTGVMSAIWNNGYTERWGRCGYSIEQKLYSFYLMTEQEDKANELLYGPKGTGLNVN